MRMESSTESGITRRGFLCSSLAVALAASSGLPLTAAEAASIPAAKGMKKSGSKISLSLKANPGLAKSNGLVSVGKVQGYSVVLVRTANKELKALVLSCTHQGVALEYNGKVFGCPAHGSVFNLDGSVKISPAQTPLPTCSLKVNGDIVTIDVSKIA